MKAVPCLLFPIHNALYCKKFQAQPKLFECLLCNYCSTSRWVRYGEIFLLWICYMHFSVRFICNQIKKANST